MKPKSIITTLLLTFVIVSIGFLLYQEYFLSSDKISSHKIEDTELTARQNQNKIIVYYFHRIKRCPTCIKIEEYSDEAIKNGFTEQLKNGSLEWKIINIEDEGNEHFENDYELYTQSLVIVEIRNGKQQRWKNLEKIWELVGMKEAYLLYVQDEVKTYLNEST